MAIVSFNFTKIVAEKKAPIKGKIQIQNNIAIKDVSETDLSLGKTKQKALKYVFQYISTYEPKIGEIVLTGEVISIEDEKKMTEVAENWKKNKKLTKDVLDTLLNNILTKANIQALMIGKEVNLPPSIPLPKAKLGTPVVKK